MNLKFKHRMIIYIGCLTFLILSIQFDWTNWAIYVAIPMVIFIFYIFLSREDNKFALSGESEE